MDIESLYDKYAALLSAHEALLEKYDREKKGITEFQARFLSLSRELEEQAIIANTQKKAYEELIFALTPHIKTSSEAFATDLNRNTEESKQLKTHIKLL